MLLQRDSPVVLCKGERKGNEKGEWCLSWFCGREQAEVIWGVKFTPQLFVSFYSFSFMLFFWEYFAVITGPIHPSLGSLLCSCYVLGFIRARLGGVSLMLIFRWDGNRMRHRFIHTLVVPIRN
jgi:hypothetical protein